MHQKAKSLGGKQAAEVGANSAISEKLKSLLFAVSRLAMVYFFGIQEWITSHRGTQYRERTCT